MSPGRPRTIPAVLVVLACVLLVGGLWALTHGSTTAEPATPPTAARTAPQGGLRQIAVADLPPEARHTLELVRTGGPFPYERDGAVFQNREGLLPREPRGYYHEYTVPTPGEADRGARRIITGRAGELYWTQDHYDSFSVIREGP
jgi:ribonuclease T1